VPGGAGSRKFHVDVEGQRKLTDYDIFQKAGGALKARQETFRATVSDGVLNLLFSKGSADVANLRALEVVPATAAAREAVAGPAAPETASAVKLFPNPAREQLFVELPVPAGHLQMRAGHLPDGLQGLVVGAVAGQLVAQAAPAELDFGVTGLTGPGRVQVDRGERAGVAVQGGDRVWNLHSGMRTSIDTSNRARCRLRGEANLDVGRYYGSPLRARSMEQS